jgi:hypothetical protein
VGIQHLPRVSVAVRYFEAGPPRWDLVGWYLRSAVLAKRRAEGGSNHLSRDELAGRLAVDRLVAGFAYARCMIGTGLGVLVGAVFVVPARALPAGWDRAPLYVVGFALGAMPAAVYLVVLVWFSIQPGRYRQRVMRTSPASVRAASIWAWLIASISGIVFAFLTCRSR